MRQRSDSNYDSHYKSPHTCENRPSKLVEPQPVADRALDTMSHTSQEGTSHYGSDQPVIPDEFSLSPHIRPLHPHDAVIGPRRSMSGAPLAEALRPRQLRPKAAKSDIGKLIRVHTATAVIIYIVKNLPLTLLWPGRNASLTLVIQRRPAVGPAKEGG